MAGEPLRWSPEKQRAPSNRRAGRFRNQQGGDECFHRVERYERVKGERQCLTETACQDRGSDQAEAERARSPRRARPPNARAASAHGVGVPRSERRDRVRNR